jgi:hypothetical protein
MNSLFDQIRKASRTIPLLEVSTINQVLLDIADKTEASIELFACRRMKRIWQLWTCKTLNTTASS